MILAIDTSTRRIGIALHDGDQVLNEMVWSSPFQHTVELAPSVALSLERTGVSMDAVQAIAVATGPGSFTALRTGLAFAKGLALAGGLPLIGFPSLQVAAACLHPAGIPLCAVLEAGRKRLAAGWFQADGHNWSPEGEPELLTAGALAERIEQPTLVAGELDPAARAALSANPSVRLASPAAGLRRPAVLAELGWSRWQSGDSDDPAALSPVYLTEEGLVR